MRPIRKVSEWFKYERLHHYPELAAFDREAALNRLQAYGREEYQACQRWLMAGWLVSLSCFAIWGVLVYRNALFGAFMFVPMIPGWTMQYVLHRRIRRRIRARLAEEIRDGRVWKCLECEYDLRASEEKCPECGAPVRYELPMANDPTPQLSPGVSGDGAKASPNLGRSFP